MLVCVPYTAAKGEKRSRSHGAPASSKSHKKSDPDARSKKRDGHNKSTSIHDQQMVTPRSLSAPEERRHKSSKGDPGRKNPDPHHQHEYNNNNSNSSSRGARRGDYSSRGLSSRENDTAAEEFENDYDEVPSTALPPRSSSKMPSSSHQGMARTTHHHHSTKGGTTVTVQRYIFKIYLLP